MSPSNSTVFLIERRLPESSAGNDRGASDAREAREPREPAPQNDGFASLARIHPLISTMIENLERMTSNLDSIQLAEEFSEPGSRRPPPTRNSLFRNTLVFSSPDSFNTRNPIFIPVFDTSELIPGEEARQNRRYDPISSSLAEVGSDEKRANEINAIRDHAAHLGTVGARLAALERSINGASFTLTSSSPEQLEAGLEQVQQVGPADPRRAGSSKLSAASCRATGRSAPSGCPWSGQPSSSSPGLPPSPRPHLSRVRSLRIQKAAARATSTPSRARSSSPNPRGSRPACGPRRAG